MLEAVEERQYNFAITKPMLLFLRISEHGLLFEQRSFLFQTSLTEARLVPTRVLDNTVHGQQLVHFATSEHASYKYITCLLQVCKLPAVFSIMV